MQPRNVTETDRSYGVPTGVFWFVIFALANWSWFWVTEATFEEFKIYVPVLTGVAIGAFCQRSSSRLVKWIGRGIGLGAVAGFGAFLAFAGFVIAKYGV